MIMIILIEKKPFSANMKTQKIGKSSHLTKKKKLKNLLPYCSVVLSSFWNNYLERRFQKKGSFFSLDIFMLGIYARKYFINSAKYIKKKL